MAIRATARGQFQESLEISDRVTNQELARIYLDAANEVEELVETLASKPSFASKTRRVQLVQVQRNLRSLSDQLWGTTGESIRQAIFSATDLAATQLLDLDAMMGMPVSGIAGYAENMYVLSSRHAMNVVARKNFGHTLSERVYMNSTATVSRVSGIVDRGLAQGLSARDLAARVRQFISPDVAGGASYAASRLARTEINNAYHTSRIEHGKTRPWIERFKWNLSSSHPRTDICNVYAERPPFPKLETPSKPHPQCFCYVTPVMPEPDEFMRRLNDGQYDDWLDREGVVC